MTRRRLLLALAAALLVVGLWLVGRRMREPRVQAPVATERRGAPALVPGAGKDELAGAPGALALVAGPRGAMAGRVRDPAGGAIEGAVVCATGQSDELSAAEMQDPFCVRSDKTGAYEIAGLLPARYDVDASAAEHQPGRWMPERRESIQLAPGQRRAGVDLILRRGGVLVRGRAKDIGGGTVAGAVIQVGAGWNWFSRSGSAVVRADEQGEWRAWVAPGPVSASASAPGYSDASKEGVAPGSFIELLLTPESVLQGQVVEVESRAPVAGALVSVVDASSPWSWEQASALSDREGRFRIDRLAPGRYKAVADTADRHGEAALSVLVGVGQRVADVTVELHPASELSGRVVLAGSEQPCPEGMVTLHDSLTDRTSTGRISGDGQVRFRAVLPGKYQVDVTCRDHHSEDRIPAVVVTDRPLRGLVWRVHPGRQIAGVVQDADGAGAEGMYIMAHLTGGDPRGQRTGGGEPTAADGSFHIKGLLPGNYQLTLLGSEHAEPAEPIKVLVEPGRDATGVRIVLPSEGKVAGKVVDEDGQAVPVVTVSAAGEAWRFGSDDTISADDGSFVLTGLRPGQYRVYAQQQNEPLRAPGTGDDDVQGVRAVVKAGATARVKLVVERRSGRISGRVLQAGAAVTDAFVDAEREPESAAAAQGSARRAMSWGWSREPVLTDTEGNFTLTRLRPGRYTLRAYRKGGGEAVLEHVALGTAVTLVIKPTGLLAGTVSLPGRPAPEQVRISVDDSGSGFSRGETFWRTDGAFHMRDLPAGRFRVTAAAREGTAETDVVLAEGDKREGLVLVLRMRAIVRGQVVALDTGKPLPGMEAQVSTPGEQVYIMGGDSGEDRGHLTDAQGQFEVKDAPAGRVVITLYSRDWQAREYDPGFARALLKPGEVNDLPPIRCARSRLGPRARGGDLGFSLKQERPDPNADPQPAVVAVVRPGGPAAGSGLRVGDTIASVDGQDITGSNDYLFWSLARVSAGTRLTLGLARGATVTITAGPPL